MEVIKAVGMYALTGIITAIATRYHLNGEQAAALTADVMALTSGAVGVVMHQIAYKTDPKK